MNSNDAARAIADLGAHMIRQYVEEGGTVHALDGTIRIEKWSGFYLVSDEWGRMFQTWHTLEDLEEAMARLGLRWTDCYKPL